jgi:putative zinc finger/helix-turn-helix YgiT family protein
MKTKTRKLICLRCDNDEFVSKPDSIVEQEFRGETFKIKTPMSACSRCGWTTAALDQVDKLRRHTADAYRRKHGMLTSVQIISIRKLLHKNQQEFADHIGVDAKTVQRWETWLVQENRFDTLMRSARDAHLRNERSKPEKVTLTPCPDCGRENEDGTWFSPCPSDDCPSRIVTDLLDALKKAQEDINWMLNNRVLLIPEAFNYIEEAITKAEGE